MIFKFFSKEIRTQRSQSLAQDHTAGIKAWISWLSAHSFASRYRWDKIPSRLAHVMYFPYESLGVSKRDTLQLDKVKRKLFFKKIEKS